jgi:hypothetical protein
MSSNPKGKGTSKGILDAMRGMPRHVSQRKLIRFSRGQGCICNMQVSVVLFPFS